MQVQQAHLVAAQVPLLRTQSRSKPAHLQHAFTALRTRRRTYKRALQRNATRAAATGAAGQQGGAADGGTRTALYPAGKRQARLRLPALVIYVDADSLLESKDIAEEVGAAVSGGVTAVVLTEPRSAAGSAARLYDAAVRLKELLRGRAALLVLDRTDIADAVGADGVLLSPSGLPTVVAKGMVAGGLGLVGRQVDSPTAAAQAAAEGANFVILSGTEGGAPSPDAATAARQQQRSSASIPVVAAASGVSTSGELTALVETGVDGVAVQLGQLMPVATALRQRPQSSTGMAAAAVLKALGATPESAANENVVPVSSIDAVEDVLFPQAEQAGAALPPGPQQPVQQQQPAAQLSQLLSASREALVEAERTLLTELLDFLSEACPSMEESSLLADALKQLDELFLLVVVGEFNSGKSAVVNALLGERYLAEGILPTTNEISVLKWGESDEESDIDTPGTQDQDGVFTRRLPAELLREVNVVDTPGTNVILDRQQRLTEEYVPRADLVLFVMSADRPFTDSEVRFLKYVRQWGKKVIFVVNKVDLLASEAEVDEVVGFVRDNAARLLGVGDARVLPVSARSAMQAKLAARKAGNRLWAQGVATSDDEAGSSSNSSSGGGALTPEEAARLAADPAWQSSRFENLERFIYQFLVRGGTSVLSSISGSDDDEQSAAAGSLGSVAGESVRLKLQTPLFMAEALLESAGGLVGQELEVARDNLAQLKLVRSQLQTFKREMDKEGQLQREEVGKLVRLSAQRAGDVVDSTLKLSNWPALAAYLLSGSREGGGGKPLPVARRMRAGGIGEEAAGVRSLVREHTSWLETNCQRQLANYKSYLEQRVASLGLGMPELLTQAGAVAAAAVATPSSSGDDSSSNGGEAPTPAVAQLAVQEQQLLLGGLESDADARRRWREVRQAAAAAAADASDYSSWRRGSRRGEASVDDEDDESALAATGALDPRRTEVLLEEESREAVFSTVGTAGAAAAFGIVLTWVLPTTLEDLMALGLASMVGYISVLSLPMRRAEARRKLEALSASYAEDIQNKMQAELTRALDACEAEVLALIAPLEVLGAEAVARAEGYEARRKGIAEQLEALKQRVANVE